MDLTLTKVRPFLANPLQVRDESNVAAWLTAINALFTARFGSRLTPAAEPIFLSYAADAVARRLDKRQQMLDSQGMGPANVRWNSRSSLGGWFLPEEIADMDQHVGMGGVRTVRTPAPDGVRFGNLSRTYDFENLGDIPITFPEE